MKITILIPVFNEVNTIELILKKIKENKNLELEVIVIDDNSSDGTYELLEKIINKYQIKLIKNSINKGKGFSIREGLKLATGKIIIIQDADLEYDPADYNKLISPILKDKADVVYGTRFSGSGERKVHFFWHTIANQILTFLCNIKTNLNLTDMECGYKAFKTEIMKNINLKENRFGFEPEITIKLARNKISFYEVSINYYGRSYEEGKKIKFKDALRALYVILIC
jgi:glycosyltransferase involved in cell wall biosynthesis